MSAHLLGVKKVPVDAQDYETEAPEYSDLVADNRVAELAEINQDDLRTILGKLGDAEIEADLSGYVATEIDALIAAAGNIDPDIFSLVEDEIEARPDGALRGVLNDALLSLAHDR